MTVDAAIVVDRRRWAGPAILVGLAYVVVGVASAYLAANATSHQMRAFWRLFAWVASAVIFAAHILYDFFRLRIARLDTAVHAAAAVALGAFGIAAAANVHAYIAGSSHRAALRISLIAWPILAGVPAFVVALVAAYAVGGVRARATPEGT